MMYLCQQGCNLAICSEDRVQARLFIELNEPDDLKKQFMVTKFQSFLKVLLVV